MNNDFIRTICINFPDVKEDIKWEHDLCFLIGGKMFCVSGLDNEFGVSLKVIDEEFEELTTRDGIIPAPYLARHKWIFINDPNCFTLPEWNKYLKQSYELIKMKLPKSKISGEKKSKRK